MNISQSHNEQPGGSSGSGRLWNATATASMKNDIGMVFIMFSYNDLKEFAAANYLPTRFSPRFRKKIRLASVRLKPSR